MAIDIQGEDTVTVKFTSAAAGVVSVAELRELVSYIQELGVENETAFKAAFNSASKKLTLSIEVPANSYLPYETPAPE